MMQFNMAELVAASWNSLPTALTMVAPTSVTKVVQYVLSTYTRDFRAYRFILAC